MDEELRDILIAISVVAKMLATLMEEEEEEKGEKKEWTVTAKSTTD